MENIVLTTPEVVPQITTTDYRVVYLQMEWERGGTVIVHLRGTNGEKKEFSYKGDEALTLMRALNVANLSTKSLHRRILERLVTDGFLAGTVAGSPDLT